jgi:hypothetical protein
LDYPKPSPELGVSPHDASHVFPEKGRFADPICFSSPVDRGLLVAAMTCVAVSDHKLVPTVCPLLLGSGVLAISLRGDLPHHSLVVAAPGGAMNVRDEVHYIDPGHFPGLLLG